MIGWVAAIFACLICLRVGWVWRRNAAVVAASRVEGDLARTLATLDEARAAMKSATAVIRQLTADKSELRRQLDEQVRR